MLERTAATVLEWPSRSITSRSEPPAAVARVPGGVPQVVDNGSARSVVEVVAEELGASLRWATATTTRATRSQDQ